MSKTNSPADNDDIELELLLEAIYRKYHYDFRAYARASLSRRLSQALEKFSCRSLSGLQEKILREPALFTSLLNHLTIQCSEMFRDPVYFLSLRRSVLPILSTYPSLKIWVAGCSTGEESYSLAIILREENLLDRTTIYATDINPDALSKAAAGVFDIDRIARFSKNYQHTEPKASLSDYYTAAYGAAVFDKSLRERTVFADHSLATDQVFSEVHFISCRNVLIYFDRDLQTRAMDLFDESLCHRGFLGLGSKESMRFTHKAGSFQEFVRGARIYRKA